MPVIHRMLGEDGGICVIAKRSEEIFTEKGMCKELIVTASRREDLIGGGRGKDRADRTRVPYTFYFKASPVLSCGGLVVVHSSRDGGACLGSLESATPLLAVQKGKAPLPNFRPI